MFVYFIRFAVFGKEVNTSKNTHGGVHSFFCENESRACIRRICLQNNHWNGDNYQHNVARLQQQQEGANHTNSAE